MGYSGPGRGRTWEWVIQDKAAGVGPGNSYSGQSRSRTWEWVIQARAGVGPGNGLFRPRQQG